MFGTDRVDHAAMLPWHASMAWLTMWQRAWQPWIDACATFAQPWTNPQTFSAVPSGNSIGLDPLAVFRAGQQFLPTISARVRPAKAEGAESAALVDVDVFLPPYLQPFEGPEPACLSVSALVSLSRASRHARLTSRAARVIEAEREAKASAIADAANGDQVE